MRNFFLKNSPNTRFRNFNRKILDGEILLRKLPQDSPVSGANLNYYGMANPGA